MPKYSNPRQGDEESGLGANPLPKSKKEKKQEKADAPMVQPIKNGYRNIAHLMAYKDSPFAIFRRFGQLNMLNLLCLQAELMELQSQFRRKCKEDDLPDELKAQDPKKAQGGEEADDGQEAQGDPGAREPQDGDGEGSQGAGQDDQQDYQDELDPKRFAYSFTAMMDQDEEEQSEAASRRRQYRMNQEQDMIATVMRETSQLGIEAQARILASLRPPSLGLGGDFEESGEPLSQYRLLLKIRGKLKEYNETVLQLADMEGLSRPKKHNLECFRTWLFRQRENHMDGEFSYFAGDGDELPTWDDMKDLQDFVAIQRPESMRDPFQERISYWMIWLYEQVKRHLKKEVNNERPHLYTKFHEIAMWPSLLGAALAAMVPVAAILGLFHVKHTVTRIYVLMGITCAVALGLKLLTSAKTTDVFAITAAFVAVEVVFVGSAPSG